MLRISERLKDPNDLLRQAIEGYICDIHCSIPAVVSDYNITEGTVSVQPMIRQKVKLNGNLTWKEYPLCINCPVVSLKAGGFAITFPIQPGDEGWLFFADNQIDHFWETGKLSNQSDIRFHDLSDGFFLPSTISQPKKLSNMSGSTLQIRNDAGTTFLEITNTGNVNITATGSVTIQGKNFINHTHTSGSLTNSAGPVTGSTGGVI